MKGLIAASTAPILSGCARERPIRSAELPVYGVDPLAHTAYLGSDERYHHFVVQHGKANQKLRMSRDEATIEPDSFPVNSGRLRSSNSRVPGQSA